MHLLIGAPPVSQAGPSFFHYSISGGHLRHFSCFLTAFRQNNTTDDQSLTAKTLQLFTSVNRMLISAALL